MVKTNSVHGRSRRYGLHTLTLACLVWVSTAEAAGTVRSIVDNVNDVGRFNSIAIGDDGLPIISYVDYTADSLKVAKCNDSSCSGGDEIVSVVDDHPSNFIGWDSFIAIGSDKLPIIGYRDASAGTLKVAKCNDGACSGGDETISTVDNSGGNTGYDVGIAMGADGLPVIVYHDWAAGLVKVAKCNDHACSGGNETISILDSTAIEDKTRYPSIAVPEDGLPVITYNEEYDESDSFLKVAKCNDPACSGGNETISTVAVSGDIGSSFVTIGSDDLPVISYHDRGAEPDFFETLRVIKCDDPACSSTGEVITTVDDAEVGVGWDNVIAIGSDNNPVISYFDAASQLRIAKCHDLACAGGNESITILAADTGSPFFYNSLAVDVDGLPVVSYYDNNIDALMVAHCGTPNCVDETPPAGPSGLTACVEDLSRQSVRLEWSDNSGDESGFIVERRTIGPSVSNAAPICGTSDQPPSITPGEGGWEEIARYPANARRGFGGSAQHPLECETQYEFRVVAYNDSGSSPASNIGSAITGLTVECALAGVSGVTSESSFGSEGGGDGQFSAPAGAEVDGDGNVVIADTGNNRVQQCDPEGTCTTLGGSAARVTTGAEISFLAPEDVAIDSAGRIIVADTGNHRIQVCDAGLCTSFGGLGDAAGLFDTPRGVAVDPLDRILVADSGNDRIQRCDVQGNCIVIGGSGSETGQFNAPAGITAGYDLSIWVADTGNHRIQHCDGEGNCTAFGGFGTEPGAFDSPTRIGMDLDERLVIADSGNQRVQLCNPEGDCVVLESQYDSPLGVTIDNNGQIVVVDSGGHSIELLCLVSAETSFGARGNSPGEFSNPSAVALDSNGRIIVADRDNDRVQSCDSAGICTSFGAGGSSVGNFSSPSAVAVDDKHRIIVADTDNHRIQVCNDAGVCSAFGGMGTGPGEFYHPGSLALSSSGAIIVADTGNDRVQICDYSGDCSVLSNPAAPGGVVEFSAPAGVAFDGNLQRIIVADDESDGRIRSCDLNGNCTTLYPSGASPGEFLQPRGIAMDEKGRMVIADSRNGRIQICETGSCSAIGGPGTGPGQFAMPSGVATGAGGRIVVADTRNHRIQVLQRCAPTKRLFFGGFEE